MQGLNGFHSPYHMMPQQMPQMPQQMPQMPQQMMRPQMMPQMPQQMGGQMRQAPQMGGQAPQMPVEGQRPFGMGGHHKLLYDRLPEKAQGSMGGLMGMFK